MQPRVNRLAAEHHVVITLQRIRKLPVPRLNQHRALILLAPVQQFEVESPVGPVCRGIAQDRRSHRIGVAKVEPCLLQPLGAAGVLGHEAQRPSPGGLCMRATIFMPEPDKLPCRGLTLSGNPGTPVATIAWLWISWLRGSDPEVARRTNFELIATEPIPIGTAAIDVDTLRRHPPVTECALLESADVLKRCTGLSRRQPRPLPTILATGIARSLRLHQSWPRTSTKPGVRRLAEGHHGRRRDAPGLHVPRDHIGHSGR